MHKLEIAGGAHRLRHYFATAVYRKGLDLRLTQELMGHASPATTAVYALADMHRASGIVGSLRVVA